MTGNSTGRQDVPAIWTVNPHSIQLPPMNEELEIPDRKPLLDALTYPVRGSGRIILVIGAVLSAVLGFAAGFSLFGGIASLLGLAYFNAYYHNIVESTVSWNEEPPDWPDVSDLAGEMIVPLIRTVGVFLLSILPMLGAVALRRDDGGEIWSSPLVWLGILWGVLYFPMAILHVIVSNEMVNALPWHVLPKIRKALPVYLLLAGLLLTGLIISGVLEVVLGRIPLVGGLLAAGAGLYFMMAQARLAGIFYRDQLGAEESAEADGVL